MAFGYNSVSQDALLKELYSSENVEIAVFKDNPYLGMISKNENVPGRHYVWPMVIGTGQGRSATFTTSQTMAGKTGAITVDYLLSLVENTAVANVATKFILQTKNDAGSFLRAVKLIADVEIKNLALDLAIGLYRTADGNRGQISSTTTVASSSLKLANAKDVYNFEVGMQLDLAAAQSTGNTRAYGSGSHGLYVVAVNYDTFTLTIGTTPVAGGTPCNITDATDGIPAAQTGDYIYVTGDRNAKMSGYKDWIPFGGPSATAFFGVVRTTNPTRLAGRSYDGTAGEAVSTVIENAMALCNETGGMPDKVAMTPKKFAQLSNELGSKAQLTTMTSTNAKVGYSGIKVAGAKGEVTCFPDRACPSDLMAMMELDAWELLSVDKAPHVWDYDNQIWLRSASDNGMEIRFQAFSQVLCKRPMGNVNIKVTP